MLKKFKTKELVFIALMAALLLILNLTLGTGLIAITGIPMISGIVTALTFGFFCIIMLRTLPKFGTFTLFLLVYAILELPTTLGGAPGFWPKIPINVITGLVGDIFLLIFRYKKWAQYSAFYLLVTVNTLIFVYFLKLFNIAGVDKLISILWWFIPLYWIISTFGIFAGLYMLKKLRNNKSYKQIWIENVKEI